jgi:hypothetical protein
MRCDKIMIFVHWIAAHVVIIDVTQVPYYSPGIDLDEECVVQLRAVSADFRLLMFVVGPQVRLVDTIEQIPSNEPTLCRQVIENIILRQLGLSGHSYARMIRF